MRKVGSKKKSLKKKRGSPKAAKKRRRQVKPPWVRSVTDAFVTKLVRIGEGGWENPPHIWQIENFVAWEGTCTIAAAQKSGKTWLALEMAVSTAAGILFLGAYAVNKTGPVIIYSPELKQVELESRIAEICARRGLNHKDLDIHINSERGLQLEAVKNQIEIDAVVARLRPALIIFDPLKHCFGASLKSDGDSRLAIDFLVYLSREYKSVVVLVNHIPKSARGHMFGGQGSSNWGTFAESNLSLLSTGENRSELVTEQRHGSPIKLNLRLDGVEGRENRCVVIENPDEISAKRKICEAERMERVILEYIRLTGPVSFNQIDAAIPGRRIMKLRLLQGLKKTNAVAETADEKWGWCMNVVPGDAHISGSADKNTEKPALGAVDVDFSGDKNQMAGETAPVPVLADGNTLFLTHHKTVKPVPVAVEGDDNS